MFFPQPQSRAEFPPLPPLASPWREARDAADEILTGLWMATTHAQRLAGGGASSVWVIPAAASTREDTTTSPDFVLNYLVEIWIRSNEADPGAKLLQQATPLLRKSRANLGQTPITVAEISGGSWGEWLLRTAQGVTQLSRKFGCDSLIDMVLNAYPWEDVAAHPWQFGLVVPVWRSRLLAEQPEFAALVHTSRTGYVRSEFCRRLMSRGQVGNALDAVQFDPLCKWVRSVFGQINFIEMRHALEMEFSAALEAFPPPPRLTVDLATNVITLDNVKYKTDPRGAAVVKAMLDAQADGELPTAISNIRKRIHDCHHDTTFHRWKDTLPDPVRKCIQGKGGGGTYLELPPL